MNMVITGSTKGIGKALANEFLNYGDNVIIFSRNQERVDSVVSELNEKNLGNSNSINGCVCDVSNYEHVKNLANFAVEKFCHHNSRIILQ